MSATNLTKNLKLPQFVASDKPSWLGDVNGAMLNIDNGYSTLTGDISKANDTASSAKSQSDANTQTLVNVNSELESQGNRITALEAGGGTEQLEQRVGTLETDVEALQTRANTFEEEIAQNGTNINSLTGRVTTVEGKVKTNTDNITSLQTTTEGLNITLQEVSAKANHADTTATSAQGSASNALQIASSANNTAQNNSLQISSLQTQINSLTGINVTVANNKLSGSTTIAGDALMIGNPKANTADFIINIRTDGDSITTAGINIGRYDITNVLPNANDLTAISNDSSLRFGSSILTLTASKNAGSKDINFTLKSNGSVSAATNFTFAIHVALV